MNFRVGQKVVCVDDDWSRLSQVHRCCAPNRPSRGNTYTIRAMSYVVDGRQTVLLEEIKNGIVEWKAPWGKQEPAFYIGRFRPLVEKKTDISIFTEMLKTKQRELISR